MQAHQTKATYRFGRPPAKEIEVEAVDASAEHRPSIVPETSSSRFRPAVGWIIALVLFVWRPLELAQDVPDWIYKLVVVSVLAILSYKLVTFKGWAEENRHLRTFVIIFFAAIIELLVENFFNWVAAASDIRKYEPVAPLQDNVAIVMRRWIKRSEVLRWIVTWHWAHIANLLLAFLILPFSVLWYQIPYSGFAIASRALLMHIIVRIIRTLCFCAVILPNSKDWRCYRRRFPPPPDDWKEYILVGMGTLKGMGGCNDLIISGHAVAWMLPVVVITTYYRYGPLKYLVWLAYIQTSIRTTVEGWHYSVDFILPAFLCWYVWKDLDWLCPVAAPLPDRAAQDRVKAPVNRVALVVIGTGLVFCTVVAFFVGS